MKRMIPVENCESCPYHEHDDGQGYCGEFDKCTKFNFLLRDDDGPQNFDIKKGIHPKCRLDKVMI